MHRFVKEPVFHFAVFSLVLFAYFKLVADDAPAPDVGEVAITEADAQRLVRQYTDTWGRMPQPEELTALVDSLVREEIMVREALALGLDRGDAMIRNRLRQKMQFLTESAAQALEPEEADLVAHLQQNSDRFREIPRISFEQVYLGETPDQQVLAGLRAALDAGTDPAGLGQRTMLPARVPAAAETQVDGAFGRGMFQQIASQPRGVWSDPVQSGFGWHLVRLTELDEGHVPPLSELRDKVLFDWRREKAYMLADLQYEALRRNYLVTVPDDEALRALVTR